jgi:hypothetical protein
MRRSICYCEPTFAIAGQASAWKFIYTTSVDLPKGTSLRFDLHTKDRSFDWKLPSDSHKDKDSSIWLELPNHKTIFGKKEHFSKEVGFVFVLPTEIKTGEPFIICIGKNNRCQTYIQRKRPFSLFIDIKGKKDFRDPEFFFIDVKGDTLKELKILTPSFVTKNKRFDVVVRFEDQFGNLTNNAEPGTLIDLSYENLRENLSWQLFVPETGFITLPNLYFNEAGVYRIQLKNCRTKEVFYSDPIKCFNDWEMNLFWGSFHNELEKTDSSDSIEEYLRTCRDEQSLHFVSTSCFESEEETSNDLWKSISYQVMEFNEDERFVVFLGFQWLGNLKEEGLRQMIYSKDQKPLLRKKEIKHNALKKIYKTTTPKELMSIPSFTLAERAVYDFQDFSNEFERVVEIYNAWGSSECLKKEGNKFPIQGSGKNSMGENAEGSLVKALLNNCRFGFIAGGYDDRSVYQGLYDANQTQYSAGLTAVMAPQQTRANIFESLYNRACYATTGARMVLGFSIAGKHMGSELNSDSKPGLEFVRFIEGFALGTKPLKEVIIFRNGKEFKKFSDLKGNYLDFALEDTELLPSVVIPSKKEDKPPFVFYYFRVEQVDGHIGWGSPVWIDWIEKKNTPRNGKKKIELYLFFFFFLLLEI